MSIADEAVHVMIVTDADGGDDWLRGGHIVASGPALHEVIRERVRHGGA